MLVPTVVYAAVALRWAVDQFQREDVLFRESEQFSLSAWLRHMLRDREPMPTGGQAALCFALILTSTWFLMLYLARQGADLAIGSVVAGSVDHLASPGDHGVLADVGSETDACGWRGRRSGTSLLAVALVVALNPLVNELRPIVESLFPDLVAHQDHAGADHVAVPGLWTSVLVFALIPAICEEFAFRGFILSGLEQRAPDPVGHLALGLDVRVSARALEPVSAALQCDAPGGRAGSPGRAEPEHSARDRLSFLEQRLGGRAGLGGSCAVGAARSSLGSIATRPKGFIIGNGSWRACCSRVSCCSSCGS